MGLGRLFLRSLVGVVDLLGLGDVLDTRHTGDCQRSRDGGDVAQRLIGHKVGNRARLAVIDRARRLGIGCGTARDGHRDELARIVRVRDLNFAVGRPFGIVEHRRQQALQQLIRRAAVDQIDLKIVELARHSPQPIGDQRVGDKVCQGLTRVLPCRDRCRMILGNPDLFENMREVVEVQSDHDFCPVLSNRTGRPYPFVCRHDHRKDGFEQRPRVRHGTEIGICLRQTKV